MTVCSNVVKVIWVKKAKMFSTKSATKRSRKSGNVPLSCQLHVVGDLQVDRSCETDGQGGLQ